MIILPTEKRFDWKTPPFILCLLIFSNVWIFFFYQSGDDQKFEESIGQYLDADLLSKEWKPYLSYLEKSGKIKLADELREAYKNNDMGQVAYYILGDKAFVSELEKQIYQIYAVEDYLAVWQMREEIRALMNTTSSLRFGLVPNNIGIVNLFSHQFLHGDFMHLLGNMFFLIICGFAVEAAIGHWRFLLFYLMSGVVGGLAHAALDISSANPLIGASGAISGVMAMYLWIFRLKKIEFFYWFYVFVGYVRLPALMVLPLYIGKELLQYFTDTHSNVAFMAHAGGFVSASILMAIVLWRKPHTLDVVYIEENQTISPFQQKLANVYQAMEIGMFPVALKQLQDIIDENQETFSLSLLQYQLTKMHRNDNLNLLVKKLLSYNKLDMAELRRQEQVWIENQDIALTLNDDELVKIGMRFSTLEKMDTSENIFAILREKSSHHEMMAIFARKLSVFFERMKNKEKSAFYAEIADSWLNGDKQ